jgi:hypothetical protein
MRNGEWRLVYAGTDLSFGTAATPVFNVTTPTFGDVGIRTSDYDNPRADGRSFGADLRSGVTISFDLGVRASSEAVVRSAEADLARAWRGDAVRTTPGGVAELHLCYAGVERVVYGRPRRYAANRAEAATAAFISVVADFDCVDDVLYDVVEDVVALDIVPASHGGLVGPLAAPLSTTTSSDRSTVIDVGGSLAAWPVIEIDGPITNPYVEVVGLFRVELATALAYDDSVTVDTRPWARTVLRNDGASLAGKLTRTSPRLPDAGLPPGSYELGFGGLDATGTATARVRWRNASPTP